MLFTDSDIIDGTGMGQIDSDLGVVAKQANIVIEGPGSVCQQAWRECGHSILQAQQMYASYLAQPGMTGGHVAAVMNTGSPARTQARVRLNQIVAHEADYANAESAIQLWMTYVALSMFYRNASSRLGVDRYEEKMERYGMNAKTLWATLRSTGLPFVYMPMEAPGAKHGANAGAWTPANLSSLSGPTSIAQIVQVAVTYYDGSKYASEAQQGNAQSGPSDVISFNIATDSLLGVDITSLKPPTGVMDSVGLAGGSIQPLNATHWNLWVGSLTGPLYLQASTPIATKTVTLAGAPTLSGSPLGYGQYADLALTFQNVVMRA